MYLLLRIKFLKQHIYDTENRDLSKGGNKTFFIGNKKITKK